MVTLYVESNFILRLALRQEQRQECERLMQAAESNSLKLAMPVLALFESLYRIRGKSQERAAQDRQLLQMFKELRRTDIEPHLQAASHLHEARLKLELLDGLERSQLASTIERLGRCAHILGVSTSLFQEAYEYEAQEEMSLESADALMLSAILAHARETEGERFFLTSDSDFSSSPAVRHLLKSAGLQLFREPQVLLTRLRARGVLLG